MNDLIRQLYFERKISLPPFKIICSICFIILLGLVRGISRTGEIGVVQDTSMPILAIVFCSDLYEMEYSGRRWEVFCLYPLKERVGVVYKRLGIQLVYLWMLSIAGYACFLWQHTVSIEGISDGALFVQSMAAVAISIAFFGALSMLAATVWKNSWCGIGVSFVVWLLLNSKKGEAVLGDWNLFAFSFRKIEMVEKMGWVYGKGVAVLFFVGMLAALPYWIKKR